MLIVPVSLCIAVFLLTNMIDTKPNMSYITKKLKAKITFFYLLCLCFFTFMAAAQRPNSGSSSPVFLQNTGGNQVEIIHTDSIVVITDGSLEKYKLLGNVSLRQGTSTMNCHVAILNKLNNTVDAFGKVKIVQADTVTITGDTAYYNGNARIAKIRGKVLLNDNTIKLHTRQLDYDLNTHVGYYNRGGRIEEDQKSTLTSKEGFYDTVTKIFMFYKDVKIVDAESTVSTDSLKYSTLSKEAFFISPTQIITKTDTMLVRRGVYNTTTKVSNFYGRSTARTKDYLLTADTLSYDTPTEIGLLKGNAEIISKKDSVILTGQFGKYFGKQSFSQMTQNALMRAIQGKDTLYLAADTLVSAENKELKTRRLSAYGKVIIFRKDLQGRCDSLTYNIADSTIIFFKKPILWANNSQSEADTISLRLINDTVRRMHLSTKSFVITQDSSHNFNQVKGRKITSFLSEKSKIERILVEGNGESVYYAVDEQKKMIGLNKVECGKMVLNFKDNAVKRIAFIGKPDAKLIPPHEIKPENKELDGFKWRNTEKPSLEATLQGRNTSTTLTSLVLAKDSSTKPSTQTAKTPKTTAKKKVINKKTKRL
jgi:lipopolysaccharide export system protein LptA